MRAIVVDEFGPPERLRVAEVPAPVPGPGEVLVEVHAAPVNYVDLLVVGGTYQFLPPRPFIPGKGPAGMVDGARAGGERAAGRRPGAGDGRAGRLCRGGRGRAPTSAIACRPRMSFAEAASLSLVYDTAWFALRERARLEPGETVLVLGASGGVGQAAVQLARAMGARVLAGISRPERAAAVRAAGADAVIDLSRADLRDSLREQVYAVTDGRGADIILDPLGGEVFEAAMRALAWRGRLVVIGFAAGGIPTIRTNYLLLKNIEISGLQISDYRKRRPAQMAACFAEIFAFYDAGQDQARRRRRCSRWSGPARRWPRCATAASTGRAVLRLHALRQPLRDDGRSISTRELPVGGRGVSFMVSAGSPPSNGPFKRSLFCGLPSQEDGRLVERNQRSDPGDHRIGSVPHRLRSRPPSAMAITTRISSGRGASATDTVIVSKCGNDQNRPCAPSGTSRLAPAAATFTFEEITALPPPIATRIGLPSIGWTQAPPCSISPLTPTSAPLP